MNWIGVSTLYLREVRRFLAVPAQTIGGPLATALLLFLVFAVTFQDRMPAPAQTSYLTFLASGLVMMGIAQNAFANTSSSLLVAKLQGNIVDLLLSPLSPFELLVGFALGGVTRGLVVGCLTALLLWPFVSYPLPDVAAALLFGTGGALMFALLGIVAGIWARRMDEQAAVTNFVIAPLTLLSGTFFSIGSLPHSFQRAARLDPFLYVVDGFRGGVAGAAEEEPLAALVVLVTVNLLLASACYRLLAIGWRLRQ